MCGCHPRTTPFYKGGSRRPTGGFLPQNKGPDSARKGGLPILAETERKSAIRATCDSKGRFFQPSDSNLYELDSGNKLNYCALSPSFSPVSDHIGKALENDQEFTFMEGLEIGLKARRQSFKMLSNLYLINFTIKVLGEM
ncbi:hypothetical protein JTE90_029639 [Oedothorax gibbosus]|uniref:Uncharacterized protein n=1 Tax=Oedothorax gibbosus TaxID=931172 RepID=A0AAV6VE28_9ARAC|nr:hypothetical protein JTE90_029639 [Oedothorax gibbosus]